MAVMRRHPELRPVPHLPALDEFVGKWVAVRDGRVVAVAASSRELAYELKNRGIRDATVEFVPEPTDGIRIGLG